MAQQIKLKRSAVAGKIPTTASLATGEIAINTNDGKLFFKRDDDTIQTIVTTNAVITGSLNINGPITGSDIQIDDWGSVSASLSNLGSLSNPTLQDVTDNGNTTTNSLEVGGLTGSGDFLIEKTLPLLVLNNQGSVPLVNGYGSYINLQTDQWNSAPVGSPMAVINATDGSASHKGSLSFDKATEGLSDIKFYNTNFGNFTKPALNISSSGEVFASGSISGSDIYINQWGSISASLASIETNTGILNLQDVTDNGAATTNSITAANFSGSYIDFTPLSNGDAPAHKDGRLYYSSDDGTLTFYNEEADISLQVGQEFYKRVQNTSGATISNGTPVRISGSQGDKPLIWPALAEDHSNQNVFENHIIGIATHDIENNSTGYVTEKGVVKSVDTTGFAAGDILYLQTGSAGFRNTPPPFPYDIIQVGTVIRSATNGFIEVTPKEPTHFNNISGLSGSVTGPGDLWVYQANGAWTPTKTLSGSYTIDNGNLTVVGNVDSNDITIDDWGSLSASLASIGVTAANNLYTSNGTISSNRTVNGGSNSLSFTNLSSFSVNNSPIFLEGPLYLGVNIPAATGSALNNTLYIDTVSGEVKYGSSPTLDSVTGNGSSTTNDISIGSLTVGSGENITFTGNAAIQTNNNSFELDADINANGAGFINLRTSNVTRAQINNTGVIVTGDLDSDDVTIDDWGSVSASLESINAQALTIPTLDQVVSAGGTTTGDIEVQNLTVNGTGSFAYIQSVTGSAKIIGDAYIILNANAPSERYAGIKVFDSGSTGETGSLEYDSVANHWFYESVNEGYASVLMSGPKASRGALSVPTSGSLVLAVGNHLYSSNVSDLDGQVTINSDTTINGDITHDTYSVLQSGKVTVDDDSIGIIGGTYSGTTYAGAVMDYVIYDATRTNQRTGTVLVSANSTTVVHSENVTTDIGNTDGAEIVTTIGSGNFRLNLDNKVGTTMYVTYNIKLLKV